jgi:hypothetical protein
MLRYPFVSRSPHDNETADLENYESVIINYVTQWKQLANK